MRNIIPNELLAGIGNMCAKGSEETQSGAGGGGSRVWDSAAIMYTL
jgi:hypothetical protein